MKYLYTEIRLDDDNNFHVVANEKIEPFYEYSSSKFDKETAEWKLNHKVFEFFDYRNQYLVTNQALKELGSEFPSQNFEALKSGVEVDSISIRKSGNKDDLEGKYYAFFRNDKLELYTDILGIVFEKLGGNERNPEVAEAIINLLIEEKYLK
jgi:hypothetical protein